MSEGEVSSAAGSIVVAGVAQPREIGFVLDAPLSADAASVIRHEARPWGP